MFLALGCLHVKGQQRLYFCIEDGSEQQRLFVNELKLDTAIIFYEREVASQGGRILNENKFREAINKKIPNRTQEGIAVIDWEQNDFLLGNHGKYNQSVMVSEVSKALSIAKKLRPNIKWGLYNIPLNGININSTANNSTLVNLLQQCDFIAPSAYIIKGNYKKEIQRVERKLSRALMIGQAIEKPVIPFVWHRVHPNNVKHGLKLVSPDSFHLYMRAVLNVEFGRKKVDAVIWWHSENYYKKRHDETIKGVDSSLPNVQTDSGDYSLFRNYYKYIDDLF